VVRYITALCLMLAGCGSSSNTPVPETAARIKANPDVIITVDDVQHACIVALSSEPQGSSIPCSDVIAFLRDELKVPSGAIYDLRTTPNADQAEVLRVRANLNDAGYRFIGGHS
jgi:hypothetical protein